MYFSPVAICAVKKSGSNLRLRSCAEPGWQVHAITGQFCPYGGEEFLQHRIVEGIGLF